MVNLNDKFDVNMLQNEIRNLLWNWRVDLKNLSLSMKRKLKIKCERLTWNLNAIALTSKN